MRSRPAIAAAAGAIALLLTGPGPAGAAPSAPSSSPAAEVCEPMVANAVEASLGTPLPAPQQGAWAGRSFTCTYPLTGGQLVLRVDDLGTRRKAVAAYTRVWKAAKGRTRLNGIGQRAYQDRAGLLVAQKDQFLLSVDPAAVPPPIRKADLAFAATMAVMTCWTAS